MKASSLALAAPSLLRAAGQELARTYRACIIGHTGRGGYGHVTSTCFQQIPGVTVVAVADPDEKGRISAARQTGAAHVYADYREMLEKERPNLVAICPYYVEGRLEMTQAAAEAGAHVYIEKPMAASLEEADAMVAATEKHQARGAVYHPMRLAPAVVNLKKRVEDGLIGELLEMRARGKEDGRAGGEDLIVCGWHCHYVMRYFAGEALWCSASVTQRGKEITPEDRRAGTAPVGWVAGDSVQASYAFPGGVQGHFSSVRNRGSKGGEFGVVLYGSKGMAQISIGPEPQIFYLADPHWSPGRSGAAWQPLPGAPNSADPSGLMRDAANNKRLVEDLIRAVETGEQSVASIYEGRAVQEMVTAVYASHLKGGRVTLPLKDRKHPLG